MNPNGKLRFLDTAGGHILISLLLIGGAIGVTQLPIDPLVKAQFVTGLWTLGAATLGRALAKAGDSQ
jgi:hypothetical protein